MDAMNPAAASYWAEHKDQLPLEPEIKEIYDYKRNPITTHDVTNFTLDEVK